MTRLFFLGLGLGALLLVSCSDDTSSVVDSGLPADAAGEAQMDLAQQDANLSDIAAADRGMDLAVADIADAAGCTSGLDLAPFSLDPAYCVVRRFDVEGLPMDFNFAGDQLWAFYPSTSDPVDWPVLTWEYDAAQGALGPSVVFTVTPTIESPADKAFATEYLALSPGGKVAVGYTVNKTYQGGIFWGDSSPAAVVEQANGNYDVLFWDDQTLLVNAAAGVGDCQQGQGVYLVQQGQSPRLLISEFGDLSGHLALGQHVLFAGGFFGTENQIYAFSKDEIAAAISSGATLTPADGDLVYSGLLLDATAWGDELVVARMSAELHFEAISGIPTSEANDAVTAGAMHDIITPGGSLAFGRLAAHGQQLAILAREGLQRTEVSVIQAR